MRNINAIVIVIIAVAALMSTTTVSAADHYFLRYGVGEDVKTLKEEVAAAKKIFEADGTAGAQYWSWANLGIDWDLIRDNVTDDLGNDGWENSRPTMSGGIYSGKYGEELRVVKQLMTERRNYFGNIAAGARAKANAKAETQARAEILSKADSSTIAYWGGLKSIDESTWKQATDSFVEEYRAKVKLTEAKNAAATNYGLAVASGVALDKSSAENRFARIEERLDADSARISSLEHKLDTVKQFINSNCKLKDSDKKLSF